MTATHHSQIWLYGQICLSVYRFNAVKNSEKLNAVDTFADGENYQETSGIDQFNITILAGLCFMM